MLRTSHYGIFFLVVEKIGMREEDRQSSLSLILKSSIAKSSRASDHLQELDFQIKQYELYKKNFARDIVFNPNESGLSMLNYSFSYL